ncbi:MAG: gluconate 5-dehydrogenase [Rikenellaceae bacterium]|jgi:gluconate 5-dehydrogenase|nr:gluconate 5-dehydrogenase [Rikenellaceae bacterium]
MNSLELFSLEGKVALVTGGTHGIGMAIAKGLAGAGARIVVNDLSPDKLEAAKREYAQGGVDVATYICNVTDEAAVAGMVADIEAQMGGVDILVNNAGIIKRIPSLDLPLQDWKTVIDVDLTAPFIVSRAVALGMKLRGGGKIINMCSMMSELGRDTVASYAAAKGGLKMLTRNLATEWARYNINVNGIGPGYIETAQTGPIREPGHPFNDFIIRRTPAMRWGRVEDLVGGAIYLASSASDFVNGHILYIDGGILASLGKAANEE